MDFVEIRQRQSVYSADQTAQKFPSLELRLLCGSMYLNHSGRLHFLLGFERGIGRWVELGYSLHAVQRGNRQCTGLGVGSGNAAGGGTD